MNAGVHISYKLHSSCLERVEWLLSDFRDTTELMDLENGSGNFFLNSLGVADNQPGLRNTAFSPLVLHSHPSICGLISKMRKPRFYAEANKTAQRNTANNQNQHSYLAYFLQKPVLWLWLALDHTLKAFCVVLSAFLRCVSSSQPTRYEVFLSL